MENGASQMVKYRLRVNVVQMKAPTGGCRDLLSELFEHVKSTTRTDWLLLAEIRSKVCRVLVDTSHCLAAATASRGGISASSTVITIIATSSSTLSLKAPTAILSGRAGIKIASSTSNRPASVRNVSRTTIGIRSWAAFFDNNRFSRNDVRISSNGSIIAGWSGKLDKSTVLSSG